MNIRILAISFILLTSLPGIFAQVDQSRKDVSYLLEDLATYGIDEAQLTDLSDDIILLFEEPVNINSGSELEISRLFFLTSFQVKSIIKYTITKGRIISLNEIAYIPGFDDELAETLKSFIRLGESTSSSRGMAGSLHKVLSNVTYRTPSDDDTYAGSLIKTLTKYQVSSGNISGGLTLEKDQGETFLDENNMPDFISGNISFNRSSVLEKIIIGDYKVRFGQGLVVWNGYSPTITPINNNPMRGMSSIKPYTSTDENDFFRGMAVKARKGSLTLHAYLSENMVDATLYYPPDSSELFIRSFYISGLHNTENSIAKKDVVKERSAGININHNPGRLSLGMSVTGSMFSLSVIPIDDELNKYDFRGDKNLAVSVDHALTLNKAYIYGEYAYSSWGGFAALQGLMLVPADRLKINLLFTNTGKKYASFHGNILGQETVNNYKKTLLINLSTELAKNLFLNAGLVKTSDNWFSSSGYYEDKIRYEARLRLTPAEYFEISADFKQKTYPEYSASLPGLSIPEYYKLNSFRLSLRAEALPGLIINSRLECNSVKLSGEKGMLAYLGMNYSFRSTPLRITLRTYVYSTDSYDTRIYAWEDDLLYSPVVKPFYYDGNRTYIMLRYKIGGKIDLNLKYGFSDYTSDEGLEHFINEIRFQLRVRI